jgi:predicted Zn-dependent peptidase
LAFFDLLEDAKLMNQQQEKYSAVKPNDVLRLAKELLKKENCTCLNYTNV